jgi:hypothetical protein
MHQIPEIYFEMVDRGWSRVAPRPQDIPSSSMDPGIYLYRDPLLLDDYREYEARSDSCFGPFLGRSRSSLVALKLKSEFCISSVPRTRAPSPVLQLPYSADLFIVSIPT